MTIPAILSALLASAVSLVELIYYRGRNPPGRASFYVIGRIVVDAGGGMVAYSICRNAFGGMAWFDSTWAVMLASLCGPALLRSQLALLGSGQEETALGPANVLRRIQRYFERQIDEIDAEVQSTWVNVRVLPCLARRSPEDLARDMKEFVNELRDMPSRERDEFFAFVDTTVADTVTDDEKRRSMAFGLLAHRGRRWLRAASRC